MNYSIIFIMMVLAFSCEIQKNNTEKSVQEKNADWQYFNEMGGNEKPTQYIIQSKQEFEKVFAKTQEDFDPKESVPTIDFSQHSVIVIHFGAKSNGGFSVKIKDTFTQNNTILVVLQSPKFNPTDPVITVMTAPILLATIPKTNATQLEYKIEYQ